MPDPARTRELYLRAHYNITTSEYNAILAHQGGVCAICGRPPGKIRLAVDHCHKSLVVRGLLCSVCNRGLRHFRDSHRLFSAGAAYLQTYPAVTAIGFEIVAPPKKRKKRRRRRR